jgi:flagellar protein FliT
VHSLAQLTQETASSQLQEQLRPTLRVILDNESQVKTLLQARMDELAKLVGQSSMQKPFFLPTATRAVMSWFRKVI